MEYITYMATQKPQILLTIDDNLLRRIDDFRFNARVNSRSEAIRQLIEKGLKKQEKPKTKKK
jgi:metal-responsive CopG/Arc/MetJ family transcriptional regulator